VEIKEKSIDSITVITLVNNRLDAAEAPDFKEKLKYLIGQGKTLLVLDLSRVGFIDSSGLGAIVSCLKNLGNRGDLVISGVQDTVMDMFRITRMDRIFKIVSSEEEAVAALS
jgi:anti-sigma B factor antagonist